MTAAPIKIETGSAEAVRPLRQTVLRPNQPPESCVYPGDDHPGTVHFFALAGGDLVGIGSLYHELSPRLPELDAWRLRGMATAELVRGAGVGGRILKACIDHVRSRSGALLWCNARVPAECFYRRYGFESVGEVFELPDIGLHRYMHLRL